jgi:epoxyqueuosine reductase
VTRETVKRIARECGFELAGIAPAETSPEFSDDFARYQAWNAQGHAGEMKYLTDRRGDVRGDVRNLLPSARSVICVGKLYNQSPVYGSAENDQAVISRYAWGADYHGVVRAGLERMVQKLQEIENFEFKICVDTAPILERTFARLAGLGWIGKNTCLINEPMGSWFFLGEIVTSVAMEADAPPPDRCGTCSRCIDACPTNAFVDSGGTWEIDSRKCIAYFTIELRGSIPEEFREPIGRNVFGCDICQDVCPWNSKAPESDAFEAQYVAPSLESCAALTESEYREMFHDSPMSRAKYPGFLRNVAVAMGNSGEQKLREPLQRLAGHANEMVAEHAHWGLKRLDACV